jgi:hypothetical protein
MHSAMENVLHILLHRPFVADGHLHSTAPSIAKSSLTSCANAASTIVNIVRRYDKAFTIRRAPYLISYATYLAATIHVRIAAKRGASSEAHECLHVCRDVFAQNAATNYAVRKAGAVIDGLMMRMGVEISEGSAEHSNYSRDVAGSRLDSMDDSGAEAHEGMSSALDVMEPTMVEGYLAPDLDIDSIIASFMHTDGSGVVVPQLDPSHDLGSTPFQGAAPLYSWTQGIDDNLFGFHSSAFDGSY